VLTAWVVFPAVLTLLCAGNGIVLDRVAGTRLPLPLLLPAGYALIVVVAGLLVWVPHGAVLATPVVTAIAVVGLMLAIARRPAPSPRRAIVPLAVACLTFLAYGAAILATGTPTYAGYVSLDDSATWFALTDHVFESGRSLDGLAPSSYEATLAVNLGGGYPIGALLPFGIASRLSGVDLAWAFQPYLSVVAALLALALYALAERLTRRPGLAAAIAFVAAQPALLYAYGLWAGVKELAAAALIPLACIAAREARTFRSALVAGVATGALLGVLSAGGALWLLGGGALWLALAVRARWWRAIGGLGLTAAVAGLPALDAASTFFSDTTRDVLGSETELGNLAGPLDPLQLAGIWPAGDFRTAPDARALTIALVALVAGLGVLGVGIAWRRRAWPLLGYVVTALVGVTAIAAVGSPWVDAKAMATASPAALLAAGVGCVALGRLLHPAVAVAAGAVVAAGVLWSNVLAYGEVWLAPHEQLAELETIGGRFAGEGPALMTEYQPVGVRHFLRQLDPEGTSELRRRPIPLLDGSLLEKGRSVDLDEHRYEGIAAYRTLVLRRSPVASRPPSPYALAWQGTWYEVWQRSEPPTPTVQEHTGLGSRSGAASQAPCATVLGLAGRGGSIGAVERPSLVLPLAVPARGTATTFALPRAARVRIWLGGSVLTRVRASIDGEPAGAHGYHLGRDGQYTALGELNLDAGSHRLELAFDEPGAAPGTHAAAQPVGPVVIEELPVRRTVVAVEADRARELCGLPLDWVERWG
jgi:hypothetical protein